jgi:hypothetical protein
MSRPSEPHLSPDDIDAWLAGALAPALQRHVDHCQLCLEQLRFEREIADQITALPLLSPTPGFSDRVMASVIVPDPFAIRSLQATRRRVLATPRSIALAASVSLLLLGSMVGSIVWSLNNQETLAAMGSWLIAQGGQALWFGIRGLTSNLIEQPWYGTVRSMLESPGRLGLISAMVSFAYFGGVIALRRLLALPTQQVAHANL